MDPFRIKSITMALICRPQDWMQSTHCLSDSFTRPLRKKHRFGACTSNHSLLCHLECNIIYIPYIFLTFLPWILKPRICYAVDIGSKAVPEVVITKSISAVKLTLTGLGCQWTRNLKSGLVTFSIVLHTVVTSHKIWYLFQERIRWNPRPVIMPICRHWCRYDKLQSH